LNQEKVAHLEVAAVIMIVCAATTVIEILAAQAEPCLKTAAKSTPIAAGGLHHDN
jgi:hypothetical protein